MNNPEINQSVSILLDHQYLGTPGDVTQGSNSNERPDDPTEDKTDSCEVPDESSLNASSIQQCFQNMLNMTALSDLDSRKLPVSTDRGECKILRLELRFGNFSLNPGTQLRNAQPTAKTQPMLKSQPTEKSQTTPKLTSVSSTNSVPKYQSRTKTLKDIKDDKEKTERQKVEGKVQDERNDKTADIAENCKKEWQRFNREFQEEVRFNALLQFTMNLLTKRWAEYLSFTQEQMFQFEMENACRSELTDEVIEVLGDHDLHVWQILDTVGEN